MPRLVDCYCKPCDKTVEDVMCEPDAVIPHDCGNPMEQIWWKQRNRDAQWSDKDAVVVYRKPDGKISYPGRNDLPTPAGCERVVMRSLREVERFEKSNNVRSEMAWFDKGSSRGHDDTFRGEKY